MFSLPRKLLAALAWCSISGSGLFTATSASAAEVPKPVLLSPENSGTAAVSRPGELALFPFLPIASKNTGAGVVVVPAAGFADAKIDRESLSIARWLAERGVAAFILRQPAASAAASTTATDVTRAIAFVQGRATEYKLSSTRLGALGLGSGASGLAAAAYRATENAENSAADKSGRPAFLALVWGAGESATIPRGAPPTFIVGSTSGRDNLAATIELWAKLRAARVPVDAHFFAEQKQNEDFGQATGAPSWPEMLFTWIQFQGFLTDQPRLALKGMVHLDGHPIPQGYVIFTPIDFVGAGPIVARVINSSAGIPIGQFTVPESQGPVAGRYKVEVRQNMNWWLSNSFSGALVNTRSGITPEQAFFGHHRALSPSIEDQRVYTKMRPTDHADYVIEFKADAPTNSDLKIEVFSK